MPVRARRKCIYAPAWLRDTQSPDEPELIGAGSEGERRRRAVLLRSKLEHSSVVESPADESAIQIRLLVASCDVRACNRRRETRAPASEIDANFLRRLLDLRVLLRPEIQLREIEHRAR